MDDSYSDDDKYYSFGKKYEILSMNIILYIITNTNDYKDKIVFKYFIKNNILININFYNKI